MIIIRKYSIETSGEFSKSVFAKHCIYQDAIIGITVDRNIIYDFYRMHDLLGEKMITRIGNNYKNDFLDKDHFMKHIHERVCKTIRNLENEFGNHAPIFCLDKHFLNNVLPTLEENQMATFQENN